MGKGAVAIKKNVFIYTYICICIYIYTCIYNKLFLCQRQWKEYHNQETGVEVLEKLVWCRRTELLLLLSKPRPVLQSLCFTPLLDPPQPHPPHSTPLIFYPPSSPSPPPSILSSFTVNASCALCRLSHVTFGLCAVQTACGQWAVGVGRGRERVGGGGGGSWRGCDV